MVKFNFLLFCKNFYCSVKTLFLVDYWKLKTIVSVEWIHYQEGEFLFCISHFYSIPALFNLTKKHQLMDNWIGTILATVLSRLQPLQVLLHWHFSIFFICELQLLKNDDQNMHYWCNHQLGNKGHHRCCTLLE